MDYRNIMVAVDNSDYSVHGVEMGIDIAKAFEASLTGAHVYAASLHDLRFRQMEGGLPERYGFEGELEKQREIHDSLITKGLEIITDSYLDAADALCKNAEITLVRKSLEGKNYRVLVDDIHQSQYDMVILGAMRHSTALQRSSLKRQARSSGSSSRSSSMKRLLTMGWPRSIKPI